MCITCGTGPLTEGFYCEGDYWCNDCEPIEFSMWYEEAEETGDFECYWTTWDEE